jgi:hypothetical protein
MLEVIGWTGSILIIVSLTQARVLRFRVLNLVGALLATGYNATIGVWPFAAMNAVITVIDAYWLWRLTRERHDDDVYAVVEVASDDGYLRHILRVHGDDITQFQPAFELDAPSTPESARASFLVVRGDETVGVVVVRGVGDGVGRVELDWVTPRFRDFTPGEFVYRRSGVFAAHGFRSLVVEPGPKSTEYLERVGFRPHDGVWQRPVDAAA